MFYVFDLDGTLANAEHRVHFIKQEPKDWESFLAAKNEDTPILPIMELLNLTVYSSHRVEIWTGRRRDQEEESRQWLSENGLSAASVWIPMRMRSNGDRREDFEVKEAYLKYGVPDLIFEDRTQMVKMWRSKGIRVAQVADGDY